MARFRYEAIDAEGKLIAGHREAEVLREVEQWLEKNGCCPILIEAAAGSATAASDERRRASRLTLRDRLFGVRLEDLILLCRQVGTMLDAGVALLKALRIVAGQASNQRLRQIIDTVASNIEGGASLSESVARYPRVFGPLFENVIRIGEESGNLDRAFNYLALLFENEKDIKERIREVTRYPKIMTVAIGSALLFLMSFVVPKFILIFSKAKVELPLATRMLITVSEFLSSYALPLFFLAIALTVAYRLAANNPAFVYLRDRTVLALPVIGQLLTKIYMARFCRIFGILVESGIDIIRILELAGVALENAVLLRMIGRVQRDVEQGTSLHEAAARHKQFPAMVVQMITVGEESGRLDRMMHKVADSYDGETSYQIKRLAALVEPVLLLVMGFIVGFIALAIFTPMWEMMNVARGGG